MISLLSLLLILSTIGIAGAIPCYVCASEELSNRWHLIGYPSKPDVFTSNCAEAQEGAGRIENCDSFCVMLSMKAFDDEGVIRQQPTSGGQDNHKITLYWVVRGCYDKLMERSSKQAELTTSTDINKRETGKLKMASKTNGEQLQIPVLLQTCKNQATVPCNGQAISATLFECGPSEQIGTCASPTGGVACNTNTGEQRCPHCSKHEVVVDGVRRIIRGCSSINPFVPPLTKYEGKEKQINICVRYKEDYYFPLGGQTSVDEMTCYCNDKESYCNRSPPARKAIYSLIMAAIGVMVYFYNAY